ncbi:TetR family transcriptional regulator [Mycobacteroides chelonae]|jgi:AcrR family transcriptional regulator|uniref:TetR family transcriptional regulator n=1 Tax=Mycobacteroides chelonae TaxID=1774 RepID=A0A1S1LUW3_MYCCH|nr:TetR/AcrR family transcriptional regulator [Mycobacteroides chelonae]MBF9315724.1 TetR/AcrR family transcriptional regulator [Mycobacteroides chelonae]OHT68183.1 TetR family transcriptional regulator [Mycobacteroides chelonae]OHT75644.1 TetR family transcriptional regulator [Mycobacteroides chelonae]OHT87247.1 TetR family transcriptional regulator [Mycobacteroides chelonae]OHU50182.1 TetR family transcriptional regulator [Mycobacteroides chelonae]
MSSTTAPPDRDTTSATRVLAPSERLLRTAADLFATQGIRAVGIDQILREAGVAKASLYSSYGSKDALIVAYLEELDQRDRNRWNAAVAAQRNPKAKVLTFFDLATAAAKARNFRGCLYANAATEFPGTEWEPVRRHREWFRATVTALLREAGISRPDNLTRQVQLLYDGALTASKIEKSVAPITLARKITRELIG